MFQIQTEVKKVEEKYSEDGRHNFHIFKSYAVTATKLWQTICREIFFTALFWPSPEKGHQIVASMGQNAGKIKASKVEIKMQMPP